MVTIDKCPICNSAEFRQVFTCVDYTTTKEKFSVVECTNCNFHLTSPRPDDDQLGRYYQSDEYISHTNKSNNFLNSVYTLARRFTLRWKIALVKKHLAEISSGKILDYGCGTGHFLSACKENNLIITGVEPSAEARTIASQNTSQHIWQNITEVSDNQDIITLWHVLEHIGDLHPLIEQLKARLNKHGAMFIAVPNRESWDAQIYHNTWAAYDVPRHLWHFTRKDMLTLMKSHNLMVKEIIPMKLDAYYVSLLSEKYKRNSTQIPGMINALKNGFISNRKAKENNNYSSLIYVVQHQ